MTIAIVDYQAGNLRSVKKALDHLGADSVITGDARILAQADKIILPGVGHFSATVALEQFGLRAAIMERVSRSVPFLGICLGMQWLFEGSEEAGDTPGLGLFAGKSERFPESVRSPHVGWNTLACDANSRLLRGVPEGAFVYFTHSYRAPIVAATVARSDYGGGFSAAVEQENVFGVQFHPEKSGAPGLRVLANFCDLPC